MNKDAIPVLALGSAQESVKTSCISMTVLEYIMAMLCLQNEDLHMMNCMCVFFFFVPPSNQTSSLI